MEVKKANLLSLLPPLWEKMHSHVTNTAFEARWNSTDLADIVIVDPDDQIHMRLEFCNVLAKS